MAGIRRNAWRHLAVACAASLATALACAQSPALDPSFGAGGRVWIGDAPHLGYDPYPRIEGTSHIIATPDGGVLALAAARLYRLDASGKVDTAYGYGAAGVAGGMQIDGRRIFETGKPALRPDGSVLVPVRFGAGSDPWAASSSRIAVIRLAPDGRLDSTYGVQGIARAGQGSADLSIAGFAVEPSGRAVLALQWQDWPIVLYRFLSTGVVDESFGPGGRRYLGFRKIPGTATAAPDGSFALLHQIGGNPARIGVLRFDPGGEVDLRFGQGQLVSHFTDLQQVYSGSTVVAHNGHVTLIAKGLDAGGYRLVLEQRDRDGRPVASFGLGGSVQWSWRNAFSFPFESSPLALDAHGGTVLALDAEVWRLDALGRGNAAYSNGGVAWLREPLGVFVQDVALAADGSVYAIAGVPLSEIDDVTNVGEGSYFDAWRMAVYRLRGTWDADAPPGDTTVVEYVNARFGHYFITDRSDEQQALDAAGEWVRTGLSFAAWSTVAPGTPRMCRFFSGDRFAPKSTHFYARDRQECDAVRWDGKWRYEADMFAVRVPEGPGDLRRCPRTTVPLYRLFNNGAGGAPNHRYVTDAATRDAMLARGWIAEGDGPDRIFACVAAK